MFYNEDSFVNGSNQDTPETILITNEPNKAPWWRLASPHPEWFRRSLLIVTSKGTLVSEVAGNDNFYQRPALIKFVCNRKLDYINMIQRIQSYLNHHGCSVIDFTFYKDDVHIECKYDTADYNLDSLLFKSYQDTPETLFIMHSSIANIWMSSIFDSIHASTVYYANGLGSYGHPTYETWLYQRPLLIMFTCNRMCDFKNVYRE